MKKEIQLEIAMQEGMSAEVRDGRVIITINTEITKRDLWTAQLECWLSKKDELKTISSGYMRVVKNKLSYVKWK